MTRKVNLTINLIDTFTVLQGSSAIRRYSRDHTVLAESVLEHSGWVTMWSLLVAMDMEKRLESVKINYEKLLKGSILHDLDEVVTGDIPRLTKYASPVINQTFKKIEKTAVIWVENFLKLNKESISSIWKDAKDKSTEGVLIKLADFASVVYKVWYELYVLNNRSFIRVAKELREFLKEFTVDDKKFLPELVRDYFSCMIGDMTVTVSKIIDEASLGSDKTLSNFINPKLAMDAKKD